jgi:hypothetical protein
VRVRSIRTRMHDCRPSVPTPEGVVVLEVVGVGEVCWESVLCGTGPMRAHAGLERHAEVYMRCSGPRRWEVTVRLEGWTH